MRNLYFMRGLLALALLFFASSSAWGESVTWDLTTASYANKPAPSSALVTWTSDQVKMTLEKGKSSTNANNNLGDGTKTTFYKNHVLTITASAGYLISSVDVAATSDAYATIFAGSTCSDAEAEHSVSGLVCTFTPTESVGSLSFIVPSATQTTSVTVTYEPDNLQSIAVSGQNTTFCLGDGFVFGGTVTATYGNGTTGNVASSAVFTGYDGSAVGEQTVNVSYTFNGVTKETNYTVEVLDMKAIAAYYEPANETAGYYAMCSTTVGDGAKAVPADLVNGKIVYPGRTEVGWFIIPQNDNSVFVRNQDKKYLSGTEGGTTLTLSNTGVRWTIADNSLGIGSNRSLGMDTPDKGFRNYVSPSFKAQIYPLADGYVRVIEAAKVGSLATICLPYAVAEGDYAGATFYSIVGKKMDDGLPTTIILTKETALEAGRPYIMVPSAEHVVLAYSGAAAETAGCYNGLVGTFDASSVPEGYFLISNNQVKKCGSGCSVAANRAYIDMDEVPVAGAQAAAAIELKIGDATMVEQLLSEDGCPVVYDLLGRPVENPSRGIYIVNGKKVMIR